MPITLIQFDELPQIEVDIQLNKVRSLRVHVWPSSLKPNFFHLSMPGAFDVANLDLLGQDFFGNNNR